METHNSRRFSLYSVASRLPDKPQFKSKTGRYIATLVMLHYALFTFMLPIVSVTWNREPPSGITYNCTYIHENIDNVPLNTPLPRGFCPNGRDDRCRHSVDSSDFWSETVTAEFGSVCNDSNLNMVPDVLHFCGILLAALTAQSLPKDFGPRRTMLMTTILASLFSFAQLLSNEVATLALFRFFMGFLHFVMIEAGGSYITDVTPIASVPVVLPLYMSMHGFGLLIHLWFSFGVPNWRYSCVFISANFAVMIPLLYFLLPESKIWREKESLELKEPESMATRIGNAARRLSIASITNQDNRGVENEVFDDSNKHTSLPTPQPNRSRRGSLVQEFASNRRNSRSMSMGRRASTAIQESHLAMTFTTMCGAPALLKITICQAIIWMGNLCTFIGTTLYIPYLVYPLDLFETGSVMACAMVLGIVGASWMSHKCARKWLVIVFAFLCGGSLIGSGLLMFYLPAQSAAILTLAVLGKFFSAALFPLCSLMTHDYYPTACRETAVAFCVMFSRLALIAVPFVIEAARPNLYAQGVSIASGLVWLPQVIFGALCLLSAFVALLLPTLNAASVMMSTVEEAEVYYKSKTCC